MAYANRDGALRALRHLSPAQRYSLAPSAAPGGWDLVPSRRGSCRAYKAFRYEIAGSFYDVMQALGDG